MTSTTQASMARTIADMDAQHTAQRAEMKRMPFAAFIDLFTEAEQDALVGKAMTDVATKRWYDRVVGAGEADLADAALIAGLARLVEQDALSADRRDRILAGLPPA